MAQEAAAASALNGMQVVDRKIQVEQAAVADRAKEPGDTNPYAQIQAHQLQHVMAAQIQQSSLAAQVAAMRVQAKTNPASAALPGVLLWLLPCPAPVLPHDCQRRRRLSLRQGLFRE